MERKLTDFYPWSFNSNAEFKNQCLLFIDRNSNGNEFAVEVLLCSLLIRNQPVILLSAGRHKSHYEYILNKNVSCHKFRWGVLLYWIILYFLMIMFY